MIQSPRLFGRAARPAMRFRLEVSPDGSLLASGGNGTVKIWDVGTKTCHAALRIDSEVRFLA
jgi:WD40 repeat protein